MAFAPNDDSLHCEWYHIGDGSGQSSIQNTPRPPNNVETEDHKHEAKYKTGSRLANQLLDMSMQVGRCLEETTAAIRPGSRALPATLCASSSRATCASVVSSATTDELCSESVSVKGDGDFQPCCNRSDTTAATSRWEKRVSLVDEKQAEMFNHQWSIVRENMQAFAKEIFSLRTDFQDVVRTVVAEEVDKRVSTSQETVTQVSGALEQEVLARRSSDNEIITMISQIKQSLSDELRDVKNIVHDTTSATVPGPSSQIVLDLESKISAASAECAKKVEYLRGELQSLLDDVGQHSGIRKVVDEPLLRTAPASKLEEQLCQKSSRCVAATNLEETGPGEDEAELHETLRGLFASVRALQEALNREIELRVRDSEEVRKILRDDIARLSGDMRESWATEARQMWAVIESEKGTSPRRRRGDGSSISNESIQHRQRDAVLIHYNRTMTARSHTPNRLPRSSSVASAASRSPSPKVVGM